MLNNILLTFIAATLLSCSNFGNDGSSTQNLMTTSLIERDSLHKEYYASGNIKSVVDYKEGKRNGKEKIFYESGNLKQERTFWDGILFGNQIHYSEKNHVVKYAFNNIEENQTFEVSFDSEGKIESKRGSSIYAVYNNLEIKQNETFELLIYIPNIPSFLHSIYITEIAGGTSKEISDKVSFKKNYFANTYSLDKVFSKQGTYIIVINLKMANPLTGENITDITTIDITVF